MRSFFLFCLVIGVVSAVYLKERPTNVRDEEDEEVVEVEESESHEPPVASEHEYDVLPADAYHHEPEYPHASRNGSYLQQKPLGEFLRGQIKKTLDKLGIVRAIKCTHKMINDFDKKLIYAHPVKKNLILPTDDEAKYYMHFSAAAYCSGSQNLVKWDCEYCKQTRKSVRLHAILQNPKFATYAIINIDDESKEVIVTFRGSYNAPNFLQDFYFRPTKFPGGPSGIRVHRGFYIAAQSLMPQILDQLTMIYSVYPDYELIYTGHSLGSAMACLATYLTVTDKRFSHLKMSFFGYGTPRVGNLEFARWADSFNFKAIRVVSHADVVGHVPPTQWGYVHMGTELWNSKDGDIMCSNTLYEDPGCSNSQNGCYKVMDHMHYFDINTAECIMEDPIPIIKNMILGE